MFGVRASTYEVAGMQFSLWSFPGGSVVKNPPVNAGNVISIPGLGISSGEMATYSSILAWRIQWTEEPGGLQSMGLQKSRTQLSD